MDLEKTLQTAILDVYKELQLIFMDNQSVKIIFDRVDELIDNIKKSDEPFYYKSTEYDKIINLLCLTYSQNKIVTDKLKYSINEIDIYKLKKIKLKVDQVLHYEKMGKYKPMSTVDFISKCKEIFGIESNNNFDYTLLISNGIVEKQKGQKVIDFKIKNTRCTEYDIRKLVDREYITKNFSHTNKSGITKLMIERFQTITMYDSTRSDEIEGTPMIPLNEVRNESKIYQAIDDKFVRELIPIQFYQMGESTRLEDYNDINLIQQIVTHLESFEIMLMRTNEYNLVPKKKNTDGMFSGKTGVIDTYLRNNSIEDSLWKAYNPMIVDEESAVKLAASIYAFSHQLLKIRVGKRFIQDRNYTAKLDDQIRV